jgi:phosphoribosylformylglycinamidine cyclo-ligase
MTNASKDGTNYKSSGVDVQKGEEAVQRIKKHVETTFTSAVLGGIGSFAGAIDAKKLKGMEEPVLLASIDGVGTKTVIAEQAGKWNGIGHDIVNHSANDLVCLGASPLLFLDYVASASLDPDILEVIVKGMSDACRKLGCILIGGESAEMPQVYNKGAHDIVGSIIGIAEKSKMITGKDIAESDVLIALPSNGLHTNGYSLARLVLKDHMTDEVIDQLLTPHSSYVKTVLKLHDTIGLKGVAHITGGGIAGNLSRILPAGLGAEVQKNSIDVLPIFELIQKTGSVTDENMYEAFNMGVGMILVVDDARKGDVLAIAEGAYIVGKIAKGDKVMLL